MKQSAVFLITLLVAVNYVDSRILPKRESTDKSSADDQAVNNPGDSENDSDSDITDRFGFNVNNAHAQAHGPGGYGASHATSYGVHAGILGPGNSYYRPLYHHSGGYAQNYNSGPDAPSTWANANSNTAPGQAGGNSGSGFSGGRGEAGSNSYSVLYQVPLFDGTVLLSNLKPNTTKDNKGSLPTQIDDQKEDSVKVEGHIDDNIAQVSESPDVKVPLTFPEDP